MLRLRIVHRPIGDAPEAVRDAWVGLTVPTRWTRPRWWLSPGIIGERPPRGQRRWAWPKWPRIVRHHGYAVPARDAVDVLAARQPEAAEWWRSNHGATLERNGVLIFDTASCEPIVDRQGGAANMPDGFRRLFPASWGRLAAVWLLAAVVATADLICFPDDDGWSFAATLFVTGTPIIAALVANWILGLRAAGLHLVTAFGTLSALAMLAGFLLELVFARDHPDAVGGWFGLVYLVGVPALIDVGFGRLRGPGRRAAAAAAALIVLVAGTALPLASPTIWTLSQRAGPLVGRAEARSGEEEEAPPVEADRLWNAQPDLIRQEAGALAARRDGTTNVYAVAVAASGTQALFGREAQAALRGAADHFGEADRGGLLLSNAAADQLRRPLATRANITAALQALAAKGDPAQDLFFIYLTSHGNREAELQSQLSDYQSIQPISAASTAKALRDARIRRRIVVVSACYSGSWIPALADGDTIVIAAAAKERTSFGCDDSRQFTVFGETFIRSLSNPGRSLRQVFAEAQRRIAAEETALKVTPSRPQANVGRNMQALWNDPARDEGQRPSR